MKVYLLECAFISKKHEVLHDFHLFAIAILLAHVKHLTDVECTGTSDDSSDVVPLADVVQKQIAMNRVLHNMINHSVNLSRTWSGAVSTVNIT